MISREEKKVEYLELIYDLIFVYIIGRNNSLIHVVEDGFVPGYMFVAYVLCTLAIIQIWNFSTFYINMFGRNGIRDHIFLFVNMYLLYYIGEGTRVHWEDYHTIYHVAWAMILLNIGLQYLLERRNHLNEPDVLKLIRNNLIVLFGEAAIVLISVFAEGTGFPYYSIAAVLFGIIGSWVFADDNKAALIDFAHLSERAMLYVVFTFGEMIIAIAAYFEEELSLNSIYFSLMAFMIVVALFLAYEMLYNHIIDRQKRDNGLKFMMIHVFLIFALNSLTTALEFMHDSAVSLLPKTVFLVSSFLLFYLCLLALIKQSGGKKQLNSKQIIMAIGLSVLFVVLMFVFREEMLINIAASIIYVYAMFTIIYILKKEHDHA